MRPVPSRSAPARSSYPHGHPLLPRARRSCAPVDLFFFSTLLLDYFLVQLSTDDAASRFDAASTRSLPTRPIRLRRPPPPSSASSFAVPCPILCRMLFSANADAANADAVADADASASASACQCQSRCQSRCQSQCRVRYRCRAGCACALIACALPGLGFANAVPPMPMPVPPMPMPLPMPMPVPVPVRASASLDASHDATMPLGQIERVSKCVCV